HNPQYEQSTLRRSLKAAGVRYVRIAELGGRRHAKKDSVNTGWMNSSFRGYADYMQTAAFRGGLERLERIGRERGIAIMCAEGFFARCHRSLIADALVVDGWRVRHISSRVTASLHRRTPFLRVRGGRLTYPGPAAQPAKNASK